MLPFVKALTATPARLAVAASVTAVVIAGGLTTFGAWTVGGSGDGYAKAVTVSNLTMNNASGATVADLYPGGTGNVEISVTNPNVFPVTITAVTANGAAASLTDPVNCTTTGVTFITTTGLTQAVAAGPGVITTFTLSGKAEMDNTSLNACQGDVFTLPVTLTATT